MRFPMIPILMLASALPVLAHGHDFGHGLGHGHAHGRRPAYVEPAPRYRMERREAPWARECRSEYRSEYRQECRPEHHRPRHGHSCEATVLLPAPPILLPPPPPVPRLRVWLGF